MGRDWVLVAAVAVVAAIEAATRAQLVWPVVSLASTVGLACLLPWRRVRPLLVVAISFGTVGAIEVVALLRDVTWDGLDASSFLLVLPYALARWASSRDIGLGLLAMAVPVVLSVVAGDPIGTVAGGVLVLLLLGAIGVAVRASVELRAEELAGMRSRERSELARELHDTVAHHVSAIAVQAQAGRVVAATRPEAAVEALGAAVAEGYDVVVIDSLSHAWMGAGGALEMVDRAAKSSGSRNSFDAWRSVTPEQNKMVDAILRCSAHVIVTMRSRKPVIADIAQISECSILRDRNQAIPHHAVKRTLPVNAPAIYPRAIAHPLRAWRRPKEAFRDVRIDRDRLGVGRILDLKPSLG